MNRSPRRAIASAATALAITSGLVAAPSSALAAATPQPGTFVAPRRAVQLGYDLRFVVARGRITGLVAHVLEQCSGSMTSTVTTIGPNLTWAVRRGRFSGRKRERLDGITVYTTLRGSFTDARTAKGIVRQESIVAGSTCDTYELRFTAKRK